MIETTMMPLWEQDSCRLVFEQFVCQYHSLLYKKAYEVLQDPLDAEDAVQDALLKAYECFLGFTEYRRENIRAQAWLCTIVQNTALNMRRDKKCCDSLDALEEDQRLEIPDKRFEPPEVALMREEVWEVMHQVIPTMPATLRLLMKLRFVLEYKYDSLALLFKDRLYPGKATSGALRTRINRGLTLLRNTLEEAGININDLEAWSEWSTAFEGESEFGGTLLSEQRSQSYLDTHLCFSESRVVEGRVEGRIEGPRSELRLEPSNYFDSHRCEMLAISVFHTRSTMMDDWGFSRYKMDVASRLIDVSQALLSPPVER